MVGGGVGAAIAILVDHARGASLWDATGKEYIDCTSQAWSLNVGHCHPRVVEAVTEQVRKFTHIRTSFDTVPKLLLAKKLSELGAGAAEEGRLLPHWLGRQRGRRQAGAAQPHRATSSSRCGTATTGARWRRST